MSEFKKGEDVEWSWGKGTAEGTVEKVHTTKVSRTIKGKTITRNADKEHPAYSVSQEGGGKALKSESELKKA